MIRRLLTMAAIAAMLAIPAMAAAPGTACSDLKALSIPDVTVTAAIGDAGRFVYAARFAKRDHASRILPSLRDIVARPRRALDVRPWSSRQNMNGPEIDPCGCERSASKLPL